MHTNLVRLPAYAKSPALYAPGFWLRIAYQYRSIKNRNPNKEWGIYLEPLSQAWISFSSGSTGSGVMPRYLQASYMTGTI